jgi:23S rRNA pseudouridine2457 synthase
MMFIKHYSKKNMDYYIIYKPFGMLSQFTQEQADQVTLADLNFHFEKDVYPVGRLDADSEGLLILTNDKALNTKLLDPKKAHPRTYWVQVEGAPNFPDLKPLEQGVEISIDGKKHKTLPAKVEILKEIPNLPERVPPIRVRKSIPDTWISLTITEGKNRQVRRMCAAIGFPVLRLVRGKIGKLTWGDERLGKMESGEVRMLDILDFKF